jgi:hypothetical protein
MANLNSNRSQKYRKKLEDAALDLQRSVSLYHPGPVDKVRETDGDASPLRPASSVSLSVLRPKPVSTSSPSSQAEELSDRSDARKPHEHDDSAVILHVEDEFASEDGHVNRRSIGSKISGDSAYSRYG